VTRGCRLTALFRDRQKGREIAYTIHPCAFYRVSEECMTLGDDCLGLRRSQHSNERKEVLMTARRLMSLAKMPVAFSAAITIGTLTAASLVSAPGATSPTQLSAMRGQLDPVAGVDDAIFISTGDQSAGSLEGTNMVAKTLEDICKRFREGMARGDVEAVLSLYDPEVSFVSESGDVKSGLDELRKELAPMASRRPRFAFEVKKVAQAGNIALMHTWWTVSTEGQPSRFVHAIEIARQQPNGEWRWLIGDPFTVGRLSKEKG
jgi:uncharacterized protein (TIGR02246 family)